MRHVMTSRLHWSYTTGHKWELPRGKLRSRSWKHVTSNCPTGTKSTNGDRSRQVTSCQPPAEDSLQPIASFSCPTHKPVRSGNDLIFAFLCFVSGGNNALRWTEDIGEFCSNFPTAFIYMMPSFLLKYKQQNLDDCLLQCCYQADKVFERTAILMRK